MKKFNNILLFIISIIIILIMMEFVRLETLTTCPKPIIEYKYIPRTFQEEQNDPVFISEIFKSMFNNSSPWSIANNLNNINKYNIL